MKICLAQINPTIGAFQQNVRKICKFINAAREMGADLVSISGDERCGLPAKGYAGSFPDL